MQQRGKGECEALEEEQKKNRRRIEGHKDWQKGEDTIDPLEQVVGGLLRRGDHVVPSTRRARTRGARRLQLQREAVLLLQAHARKGTSYTRLVPREHTQDIDRLHFIKELKFTILYSLF